MIMKNISRYESRKGSKIVVDGVEWKWYYGNKYVEVYSITGARRVEAAWVILGITPDEWLRSKWKQTNDQAVTPAVVASWLQYT